MLLWELLMQNLIISLFRELFLSEESLKNEYIFIENFSKINKYFEKYNFFALYFEGTREIS